MRTLAVLVTLLITASFCCGDQKTTTVQVVGVTECADCQKNNIKHSHAVKGLRVTIDCKQENGQMKTRGEGKLDEEGKFSVDISNELVEKEKLKEECYAQLHSASDIPCPAYDGIESSKITFVSKSDGNTHTFSTVGKLKFSPATCTSKFLWPHFKYPPFPKKSYPKWPFPKIPCPPIFKKPFFKKPFPHFHKYKEPTPPVPVYKKPTPPPVPVYKKPVRPPVPVYKKPVPPPVPVYKKPVPPPVTVHKKPVPPPVPVYKKPCPPPYKKPPIPVYKPKPMPPITKLPHFPKKPCPPIPKLPPFKFPPIPKFPPKVYEHPKFKNWGSPLFPPHP
ncbi:Proline-rich protein 2 [Bienertia sinuspersici]